MSADKILAKLAIDKVFTISENSDHEHRAAPVIDENGVYKGMFSTHEVIKSLVPSYLIGVDINLDFAKGLSPIIANHLRDVFPSRVGDHVSSESNIKMHTHTPTLEALRMLTKYGSPIPIVDETTGKLSGLISDQSAIEALLKIEAEHANKE